eukprot:jgi/Ulvmu1/5557/UM023_0093.1
MVDSSQRNAWVDKYLTALLGDGLSKEYVAKDEDGADNDTVAANYFFNLIIDDEEDGIVASWRRAKSDVRGNYDSAAVRRENQAWRIWSLKLAREEARRDAESAAAIDIDDVIDDPPPADPDADPSEEPDTLPPIPPPQHGKAGGGQAPALGRRPSVGPALGAPGLPMIRTAVPPGVADTDAGGVSPGTAVSGHSEQRTADNPFAGRVDRLYVVLSSVHGLVRGENMELGKDADTGGQVKYVVELARTLAHHPMVYRVDLLTRLIKGGGVAADYGKPEERLSDDPEDGTLRGAYIVRVPAGDSSVYLAKEKLWPHIREFADNALDYVSQMQQRLQREASVPINLFAVHGHYADAGEAAALMAHTLGVPMVLTGHSLGRNKLDHLLRSGTTTRKQIEETYAISRRIEGEERALDAALLVITSTEQEVDQQWGLYDGYDGGMAAALQYRRMTGRAMPHMEVIPPGLDFSSLKVELPADPMQLFEDLARSMNPENELNSGSGALPGVAGGPSGPSDLRGDDLLSDGASQEGTPSHHVGSVGAGSMGHSMLRRMPGRSTSRTGLSKAISSASLMAMESLRNEPEIWTSIHRFLQNPGKPVVLAMSRPDAKKNITTLVRAFGENAELRKIANLVLIMGNRQRIDALAKGSQHVLTTVLKLIDEYDLYGSVAYPKAHSQQDISDIYLLAKETRGVFVNIALQEPFGLTLIEAAVHGAPIVATRHGGPVDIINTLKNGKIVEPTDGKAVAQAILDIIIKTDKWNRYSAAGIKNILAYSWPSHCIRYLKVIQTHRDDDGGGTGGSTLARVLTQSRLRHSIDDSVAAAIDADDLLGLPDARKSTDIGSRMKQFNHSVPPDSLPFAMDDTAAPTGAVHRNDLSQPDLPRADTAAVPARLRVLDRKRLVYAMMDTTSDMTLLATALCSVLQLNDDTVGVGLLTVLTFSEVVEELKAADVTPTDLDFIVCNCGAYIMYVDMDGNWKADEAWEAKGLYRWDKKLVMRTLTRMQMNRPSGQGEVQRSDLMRLLSEAGGVDMNDGNGPIHLLLDFDPHENASLERMDNATLIDRVRKRVRRVGIRCNLTLQLVPEETTAERTRSVLHATPLRCSRALALRHIVHSGNFIMADTVFLCTPASIHANASKDGHTVVGSLCSDMATLVEGAQKVVVVPPSKLPRLSKADANGEEGTGAKAKATEPRDAAAFERLKVSLEPFSTARVLVLNAASELESRLGAVLAAPCAVDAEGASPAQAVADAVASAAQATEE